MRTGVDLMGVIFWPPNFKSHLKLLGVIYVWIEQRGLSLLLQIETGTTVPPTNQPTTLYENWCPCAISNCHLLLLCSDRTSKSNISTSSGASWGKELSQKLFTGALILRQQEWPSPMSPIGWKIQNSGLGYSQPASRTDQRQKNFSETAITYRPVPRLRSCVFVVS